MSLLLLLWLALAFVACGIGAWLTMAGVILVGVANRIDNDTCGARAYNLSGAILAGLGLLLFVVGVAMIARVLG